jgi:hypothetical protein
VDRQDSQGLLQHRTSSEARESTPQKGFSPAATNHPQQKLAPRCADIRSVKSENTPDSELSGILLHLNIDNSKGGCAITTKRLQ